MLTAHHIAKSYGIQPVLAGVSFTLNAGERLGLVGPNGSGKSTLLRILAGLETPDRGVVTLNPPSLKIGYLSQGFSLPAALTFGELFDSYTAAALDAELEHAAAALAASPADPALQDAYENILRRLEHPTSANGRLPALLAHLGLLDIPAELPLGAFSGGQKTRLALALVLLDNPRLLLLDEPTNHLDIAMLEWLEDWLANFSGAALIVSHDRTFLDHTVTRILDLDPQSHALRAYPGNYSDYIAQKTAELERRWSAYHDQEAEIRRLSQDIARTKEQARWVEITTTSRQPGVRRYAKKVAHKALSREKKLDRYLESDERVEKPKAGWQMKLEFGEPETTGRFALHMDHLAVGYPPFPPLLTALDLAIPAGERIVLTGPNGSGKTTLLRTIAGLHTPYAGAFRTGLSQKLGYLSQEQELLDPSLSALETIRRYAPFNETEARSFLHFYLFSGDDPLRPVSNLSFGERARLALASLVARGCNFLLLDEPINHLDIPSRERFEQALSGFPGTILAVVHDRYFIERFASEVWLVESGGITRNVLRTAAT